MTDRRSTAALVAAALFVLGSSLAIIGQPLGAAQLTPFLVGLGFVCVAALARERAPSVAWIGSVAATGVSATLWFDRARPLSGTAGGPLPWVALAAVASVWAVGTAAIAAAYALRPRLRLNRAAAPVAVGLVAWLIVGCVTTLGLVLAGQREADPAFTWVDVATVPVQLFLLVVLTIVGFGVAADIRAAARRADERLEAEADPMRWSQRLWALAIATGRELVPGQATAEAAARDIERTRLAGDLHAVVLPNLRRAIAEAEGEGDPERVARHLRTVDLELERLMADRWPVVLEALGLVRALEDLAERLEADGAPPIDIEVVGTGGRPRMAVERAAWRCAQIALDNAVRHAKATEIIVSVVTEATDLHLVVADDGRGVISTGRGTPDATPREADAGREVAERVGLRDTGGRGITDAKRRAADVGATVEITDGAASGTVVTFDWRLPAGR